MNNVSVAGNLTRDPELRYSPQGQAVTRFALAVNRAYRNRSGERVETTDYFTVNAWGNLGENVAESLKKGNHVVVSGRLRTRSYETEDGSKRRAVEIQAEEVAASLRWSKVQIEPSVKQIAQALDAEVVAEAPAIRATETAPQVAPAT